MDFAEAAYADGFPEVDVAGDGGGADVVPVFSEGLEEEGQGAGGGGREMGSLASWWRKAG